MENQTVLVVDDSQISRKIMAAFLEKEGYRSIQAEDGAQALKQAQEALPDLILLDVIMPGPDGYEVCRTLKADPRTAEIPIIFLTGVNDPENKVKGIELGASDYVTKPFNREEALLRIK